MSTLIRDRRLALGWSQADLAQRLDVSVPAVSQWEKSEAAGTIQVGTLQKALKPMMRTLILADAPTSPLMPVAWDRSFVETMVPHPQGPRGALLDARFGNRIPNIAADIHAEGSQLSIEDLWLVADHVTTGGTVAQWREASRIRDSYDSILRSVAQGVWHPVLRIADGRMVEPDLALADPRTRALQWAISAIANGSDAVAARHACNALLVSSGFPWVPPQLTDSWVDEYVAALDVLRGVGKGDRMARLLSGAEEVL
ncbi:MAG: helix-turn-helix transcriptional regulator [Propionibacteriaceae bacterium]|nr:helix-turn-helix transcriptional regulator [Propionibacteriaceae bacterium]